MNRQQIAYVKECLSIRGRRLIDEHCEKTEIPPEVKAAELLIQEWRDSKSKKYYDRREEIKRLIQAKEEQIVFSDGAIDIVTALKELDDWRPAA